MKVKIGPYPNRMICKIHDSYMRNKYGYNDWPENESQFEKFLEKVEDAIQTIYNCTINLFLDRREQKVKVHIDRWDTWSMDHTLAPIILPMLIQLKAEKHGAPYVDIDDCPKDLRPKEQDEHGTDDTHFARWDWVMDEMIYAFDCKANKDDVYMRFDDALDMEREQHRISNGFRLFGKYYENLWD